MSEILSRRRAGLAALVVAAVCLGACSDDGAGAANEPDAALADASIAGDSDAGSSDDAGADGGSGSDDAGADGGSGSDDAGVDGGGLPPGTPITAPSETWTWVDLEGAVCGNGGATGVGVNLTDRSDKLLVFFQGGGACWDQLTCLIFVAAANVDTGYDGTSFADDGIKDAPLFDRNDTSNPFRDASFVFVPYCTGDVHSGDNVATYDAANPQRKIHHKGAVNVGLLLSRLKATLPQATHVYVTGSSAGGYGAQFNFDRFVSAFPAAQAHLLADCSPLVQPYSNQLGLWKNAWNLQFPAGCEAAAASGTGTVRCEDDFSALAGWLPSRFPQSRVGLLAYSDDSVIRAYLGYPSGAALAAATTSMLALRYDPHANARYYLLSSGSHVMLDEVMTLSAPSGPPLLTWLTRWAAGDPAWANVKP